MIAIKPHTEPMITPRLLLPDDSPVLEGVGEAEGEEVVDETSEVRDGEAVELAIDEIDVGAAEDTMEDGLGEGTMLVGEGIGDGALELGGRIEEGLGMTDADADSEGTGGVVVLGQPILSLSQKKSALLSWTSIAEMMVKRQSVESFKRILSIVIWEGKEKDNKN